MRIKLTKTDIESGENPVEFALERVLRKHCVVHGRTAVVDGSRLPLILPPEAEVVAKRWENGMHIEPMTMEVV